MKGAWPTSAAYSFPLDGKSLFESIIVDFNSLFEHYATDEGADVAKATAQIAEVNTQYNAALAMVAKEARATIK